MEKRTEQILNSIIKEHIRTGLPVGSEAVANKCKLGVSSATIRNEMMLLEEGGYIEQPHTSAGRIPTDKAYRRFMQNMKDKKLADLDIKILTELLTPKDETAFKQTAKALSQATGSAVFWAFHRHNLYYTGIANLLSQPEFSQGKMIYDISAIIDRVDEIIDEIFDRLDPGPQVMIGEDNPFSPYCSSILSKYRLGDNTGLFGILGPMRMDYEKNLALIKFIDAKLKI